MKYKYCIMDSYPLESKYCNLVEKFKLENYFKSIDGEWRPDFVGFILTEKETIISFPKHYYNKRYKIKDEDISLLAKLMVKTSFFDGLNNEFGKYNNFPLASYIYICDYYKKHGLYNETRRIQEKDYRGRISWRNTIRKSNKVISGGNLIFLPFIVEKNISIEVFITECMIYILNDGYNRFGKFFNVGIKINEKTNNPIFKNKNFVIKQLSLLRIKYFKDSEMLLIDNLIKYFNWCNENKNQTILITKNFEKYWETMVQVYINSNLYNIKESGELMFKSNCKKYKFKKKTEYIESKKVIESKVSRNFRVEYDHLYLTLDKIAYLFDSKYYKDINSLDYKQMAYYFILKSSNNYINKEVINGLILPTEEKYHYQIHLDTRDREGLLEGLYIVEHYLNVKKVIESFVGIK